MRILLALFKGISGLSFVLVVALSFAPLTPDETTAFGPEPSRMQIVQRRLATGLLMAKDTALFTAFARQLGVDDTQMETALATMLSPPPAPEPTARRTEAGGALFVTVENP